MYKLITSVIATFLVSSSLALDWSHKCDVVDGRVKGADGKDQYVFTCKCTSDYFGRKVELSCGGTTDTKQSSCQSDFAYSEDKWVNAIVRKCSADSIVIDTYVNRGGSEHYEFPLICEHQAYSRICHGEKILEKATETSSAVYSTTTQKPKCTSKHY
ncbi:hypothetical protein K502DRAFT_348957 [Neoconidiobolus thromboides FSU 785]|nr:hypothetical protein K502DRAFT_348957 [Neoconidiobolus thromboides FSU 785]